MYTPASFREDDSAVMHSFMKQHSFATVVTCGATEPLATHMPLVLDSESGSQGMLSGHLARANPQWEQLADQSVLAIFHGPHTYVSPRWYQAKNTVPTWNYTAVHAYGRAQVIHDDQPLKQILETYVAFYEQRAGTGWSMNEVSDDLTDSLLHQIVGFRIEIERLEGKWKLNQNHEEARRRRVITELESRTDENSRQIAELMRATLESTGDAS